MRRRSITHRLLRWRPGGYLRSSGVLLCWLSARALAQVALILSLTHLLLPKEYGAFVAMVAVATLFTPLAGLGIYSAIVRDGARDPAALPGQLSLALNLWALSSLIFGIAGTVTARVILSDVVALPVVVLLVMGEITSASLVELLARAEQAVHRTQVYGAINAGLIIVRLLVLAGCAIAGRVTLQQWAIAYATASIAYASLLCWRSKRVFSLRFTRRLDWHLVKEGWPFLLATLSLRLQAEANKPIIAKIGLAPVGNFNVAQRAMDVTAIPLNSLQETLAPRLFASQKPGKDTLLPLALIIGLACLEAIAIWMVAPYIPRVLGAGYGDVSWLIRSLALLPAFQIVRNILGLVVVAANRPSALTRSYAITMVTSVLLNIWLVPRYQLPGAVAAAYLSEALTTVTLLAALWRQSGRKRDTP
jgi:O-antigen/teichoic acid export membrane protein